jgi:hypothetical protein
MRNKFERPYVKIYVGFILFSVLSAIFYRYDIVLENPNIFYTWFALTLFSAIILIWGIIEHITYKIPHQAK